MLIVQDLHAFYGKSHVLQGVSLELGAGEVVSLLGRNGAGKTTTLNCIAGLISNKRGIVRFCRNDIQDRPPHVINRQGLCLVPEHRGIFKMLSVDENLAIAARKGSPWTIEDIYRIFPRLKERRHNGGGALSGGEQQMLAIARALVNHPRVLLLDEPTEGLAPVIVDELRGLIRQIAAASVPILLVDQNIQFCTSLSDRHYILEQGRIVYAADKQTFMNEEHVRNRYLTLG